MAKLRRDNVAAYGRLAAKIVRREIGEKLFNRSRYKGERTYSHVVATKELDTNLLSSFFIDCALMKSK